MWLLCGGSPLFFCFTQERRYNYCVVVLPSFICWLVFLFYFWSYSVVGENSQERRYNIDTLVLPSLTGLMFVWCFLCGLVCRGEFTGEEKSVTLVLPPMKPKPKINESKCVIFWGGHFSAFWVSQFCVHFLRHTRYHSGGVHIMALLYVYI